MRKKQIITFVVSLTVAVLFAVFFFQPGYTGPGVRGNLIVLEVAKAHWTHAHPGVEWPTMKDLRPYLRNGVPHSVHGEIYIVNKVGAPVYEYDPKTERLNSLGSNGLAIVKNDLDQSK